MDVFVSTVLGICVCASVSLALINCVRCRKKLTEEELQQKYFEKFRKKHMSTRDRVLTNRVDVVRPRSDSQVSNMSCDKEPTYQSIKSVDSSDSQKSDKDMVDDHSFFDESFQTVVEASSYNTTGHTESKGNNSNLLSASTNLASYISFQQQNQLSPSSIPILQIPDVRSTPRSGKINRAFSGDSVSMDQRQANYDSESDDYVTPNQMPRIIVTKPSIKIMSDKYGMSDHLKHANVSREDPHSPELRNQRKPSRLDRDIGLHNPCRDDVESQIETESRIDKLYQDKLRMEGKSFGQHSVFGREGKSKGKTKLVIPSARISASEIDSDDEHTYESLSSVIAETNFRHDSVDMIEETSFPSKRSSTDNEHTYESIITKSCESLITSMAKSVNEDLPVINVEGVKEKDTSHSSHSKKNGRSSSDSDTAVVIIGRKVSWRYKPILPTSTQISDNKSHDFSNNLQSMLSQSYRSPAKSRRNSLDRYSPFPSSNKKLAFKSLFKQVASPRFSMEVKTGGHLKPTLLTELLNSASKSIGIENFNIDTPEMKVKESPKVFTVDSTVFLSPLDCMNKPDNTPSVNKDFSPLTFRATPINNFKTKFSAPIRESLPSLPDDLELVIENHCNTTVNAMSTPTV